MYFIFSAKYILYIGHAIPILFVCVCRPTVRGSHLKWCHKMYNCLIFTHESLLVYCYFCIQYLSKNNVNSLFCFCIRSETIMFLHQIFYQGLKARIASWPTLVLGECFDINYIVNQRGN